MVSSRTFFLTFALLSLCGCSFNPFSSNNEMTGKPMPAFAGAGIGAGTAALLGGSKYTVALAGLGGAALGYYLSTLNYASGGINQVNGQVYTQGDYLTIEFPTDKIFEDNSAELLPAAGPALQSVVDVLSRYPNSNIMVSASTSGFGTRRYELQLSERRARVVTTYLWAHGINAFKGNDFDPSAPTRKLIYVGYGDLVPIANNIKAASIRSNSRVQITAYPSKYQLELCDGQKVFANIGGLKEPPISSNPPSQEGGIVYKGATDSNLYNPS